MKQCFKCGQTKPLSEFYEHKRMADGHLNKCKPCTRNDTLAVRTRDIEHYRAYDRHRALKPGRKAAMHQTVRDYRERFPNRQRANAAVNRAVRSGKIKPQSCERCGIEKAFAHHEDYSKPLDVIWLCQPCHKTRHKELKELGIEI
jgi:ribosomal protein S27AE